MQSFFVSLGSCVYIYITTQSTSHNIGNIFIKQHNGRVLFVQHIPYPILFFFALKLFFQTKKRQYQNLPPSPPSYPVIGHLHFLKPPIHRTLQSLSTKYGPVFSLWFGSRRGVGISSSLAVEECFTKNDIVLANRPRFLMGKHLG